MLEFEKKIADFIKAHGLFGQAGRILLAISGGADSIALLYVMQQLLTHTVLSVDLLCAHINHQLRGEEANLDEDFVMAEAAKLKLPVVTRRIDVRSFASANKLSIETAARKLRIEALLDMARVNSCCCVATGHQKNDNAETILQRLSRGTGLRGLSGIWPVRAFDDNIKFVRPLLCVTRNEIIEYLQQQNLKWRIDHTNADCTYRRNFIRHQMLPALQQQCDSSIVEQLFGLSQSAKRFYSLVYSRAENVWPQIVDSAPAPARPGYGTRLGGASRSLTLRRDERASQARRRPPPERAAETSDDKVVMNLRNFLLESEPVKVELIRRSLTAIGSGERDLSHCHFERILQLSEQNTGGKQIELPGGFIVRREYGNLVFARCEKDTVCSEQGSKIVTLEIPGRTQFGQYLIEAIIFEAKEQKYLAPSFTGGSVPRFIEKFDLDKLEPPIVVRHRQAGDKFWPLGLPAEKKVGKFLTTAKVPHQLRRKIFIVADSEKIIWVWPIRISEQAKLSSDTRRILQLQIEKEV